MKIGLSLSLCVKDIVAGLVAESDVAVIITNTRCNTPYDWDRLKASYGADYWRSNPKAASEVLDRLRTDGKIIQPRCEDPDHQHKSAPYYWIDVASQSYGTGDPRVEPPREPAFTAVGDALRDARKRIGGDHYR